MKLSRHFPRPACPALFRSGAILLLAALAVFSGTGCSSLDEPASASFASVVIRQRSEEEIAEATAKVFAAAGYQGGASGGGTMVFEKEASRATTLSRAGVVATQQGARTMNRVRAEMVRLPDGAIRLQCRASLVSGNGDPFFDDEVGLTHLRSGPYRALLRKVEAELDANGGGATPPARP